MTWIACLALRKVLADELFHVVEIILIFLIVRPTVVSMNACSRLLESDAVLFFFFFVKVVRFVV